MTALDLRFDDLAEEHHVEAIGDGHAIQWIADSVGDRVGVIEWHRDRRRPEFCCGGFVRFKHIDGKPWWTVRSWDPLTIEPSVLCSLEKGGCGEHGFIRQGRWVDA